MINLPTKVRIGTRASALARWQADRVAGRIHALGVEAEIILIKTIGDLDQSSTFDQLPERGVFVKELEQALMDGRIDLAVHSLKDLPTGLPGGLMLAATPEREDPYDALISRDDLALETLAPGSRVATGSLRRAAQILALRPDLVMTPLRGNVATRVEKIRRGEAEATLLAVAGLRRLGLENEIAQVFTAQQVTPAMGQGALGIEARVAELTKLWTALDHPATRRAVEAERRYLARVGGGCRTPVGILVQQTTAAHGSDSAAPNDWRITALLASVDGRQLMRREVMVSGQDDLIAIAGDLADEMINQAPPEIRAMLARSPDEGNGTSAEAIPGDKI